MVTILLRYEKIKSKLHPKRWF